MYSCQNLSVGAFWLGTQSETTTKKQEEHSQIKDGGPLTAIKV